MEAHHRSQPKPFSQWSTNPEGRWLDAAHTFGYHLMQAARNYAFDRIPPDLPEESRLAAERAALDAIYGVMMLLDGVSANRLDAEHRLTYILQAQVRNREGKALETFELAPGGDGLCIGYHYWVEDEFESP